MHVGDNSECIFYCVLAIIVRGHVFCNSVLIGRALELPAHQLPLLCSRCLAYHRLAWPIEYLLLVFPYFCIICSSGLIGLQSACSFFVHSVYIVHEETWGMQL